MSRQDAKAAKMEPGNDLDRLARLVIGAAIEQARSADGKAIVEASRKLNYTTKTGPMVLNYKRIQFDAKGQVPREYTDTVGLQVQDGKYVPISPKVSGITFKFKDAWKSWKK